MKNTREMAAEYRLAHWAQVMQERNESGMSIKAYCESVGLHQNVYHYWQRKLRVAAMATHAEGETVLKSRPEAPVLSAPKGWAVCETQVSGRGSASNDEVQIEIGRGRLVVRKGADPELLALACRLLISVC